MPSNDLKWRLQFRLRTLIYAVAIVSILLALYGVYRRRVVVAEQRREAVSDFHQVAIAMLAYSTGKDRFPPSQQKDIEGNVLHGWRFLLLRDLEASALSPDGYGVAWTHPLCGWARQHSHSLYCFANRDDPARKFMTCMSVITGPDTAFDENKMVHEMPSDLIMLVEVRNSGVHWLRPWDLDIRTIPKEINPIDGPGISGNIEGGFCVAFCDATAWFLDDDVPFERLATFFTIDGARQSDREQLLGPYRLAQ